MAKTIPDLADLDTGTLTLYFLVILAQERALIAASTAADALDMTPNEYSCWKRELAIAGREVARKLVGRKGKAPQ